MKPEWKAVFPDAFRNRFLPSPKLTRSRSDPAFRWARAVGFEANHRPKRLCLLTVVLASAQEAPRALGFDVA